MKYKDLNLKKIREDNGLDFAHFTYQKGMCSCCYGPKDLPKRYWRNGVIPEHNDYTYILFKNANNGSGIVKRDDEICCHSYECISWDFPIEKLENVCKDLQAQVGNEYVVFKPKSHRCCILICKKGTIYEEKHLQDDDYTTV
ncbi:MAG: hypothetical protein UH850_14745 [Paludibacteraceae bacterium]|nr:hypothetical protein [Paludibacteraceae bacterium]